ncbi:MAG: hypothetical protein KDC73_03520 [Ignavibacteriae bacterium]|nr:hypothetical protein [Ignavibacteriota bacterium]MCB9244209.1 hypothetical protein [Ignavibacteriales bacterium]
MKIRLLIVVVLFVGGSCALKSEPLNFYPLNEDSLSSEDILKFSKAFEFIKNYPNLNETFKMYYWDSSYIFNVSISNEILDSKPIFFSEEIVEYEYGELNSEEKARLKDSIWHSQGRKLNIVKCDSSLFEFNRPNDGTDLLVFFTIPNKNKLLVSIFPYMGFYDYKKAALYGQYSLNFLFYFEGDEIVKVFIKHLT